MSYELFAQIILIVSFLGILAVIVKKIPVLKEVEPVPLPKKESPFVKIKKQFVNLNPARLVSLTGFNAFAQKVLSKIRIFSLRLDNTISSWLEKLRQKRIKESNKKINKSKEGEDNNSQKKDDYWEKLKEAKNDKNFSIK